MSKRAEKFYTMTFGSVYPLYVNKVLRKERTQEELDQVISWLTGYSIEQIHELSESETTFETFFNDAPMMHPNAHMIKGMICGVRVEEIEDPIIQKVRYMDKLVDELAKNRKMEKILREDK